MKTKSSRQTQARSASSRTLAWALREVAVAIQDGAPGPDEDVTPYTREAWRRAYRVVCEEARRLEREARAARAPKKRKAERVRKAVAKLRGVGDIVNEVELAQRVGI